MEKLDNPLGVVTALFPHGFDATDDDPAALLQSIPLPWIGGGVAVVGDIMLFMLSPEAALAGACAKFELPSPGLLGAMAGNDELSELSVLSGVMVLLTPIGAASCWGGGDTGGVDQENVAAGEALFDVRPRLAAGRDGNIVEEDADACPLAHGSPPSMSPPPDDDGPPLTKASKSLSPPPLVVSKLLTPPVPPKLINSFRDVATWDELLAPSSCSFLVCSTSTRLDNDLIKVM